MYLPSATVESKRKIVEESQNLGSLQFKDDKRNTSSLSVSEDVCCIQFPLVHKNTKV